MERARSILSPKEGNGRVSEGAGAGLSEPAAGEQCFRSGAGPASGRDPRRGVESHHRAPAGGLAHRQRHQPGLPAGGGGGRSGRRRRVRPTDGAAAGGGAFHHAQHQRGTACPRRGAGRTCAGGRCPDRGPRPDGPGVLFAGGHGAVSERAAAPCSGDPPDAAADGGCRSGRRRSCRESVRPPGADQVGERPAAGRKKGLRDFDRGLHGSGRRRAGVRRAGCGL